MWASFAKCALHCPDGTRIANLSLQFPRDHPAKTVPACKPPTHNTPCHISACIAWRGAGIYTGQPAGKGHPSKFTHVSLQDPHTPLFLQPPACKCETPIDFDTPQPAGSRHPSKFPQVSLHKFPPALLAHVWACTAPWLLNLSLHGGHMPCTPSGM